MILLILTQKNMKKNLLALVIVLFLINNVNAQMANGSTGPDFTINDINGVSISLYSDFLDQGIPVIMDISATWCPPCWSFHEGHAMKDIYMNYGMGGSGEIGILFVEGDGSTGLADLQGTGNTAGDWITGTPYPIIDDAGIANLYQISYYPTVYGICPDKTVYEIGTGSASNLMQQLIQNGKVIWPWIGIGAQDIDLQNIDELDLNVTEGVLIRSISPNGPAEKGGLLANDIIIAIDQKPIRNVKELQTLRQTGYLSIGQEITVTIIREKVAQDILITLEEQPRL